MKLESGIKSAMLVEFGFLQDVGKVSGHVAESA